jgi:DNA-binding CsgD family transcriptional regulator
MENALFSQDEVAEHRSDPMAIGLATPGFMLLDTSLHPVAFSSELLRILAYPTKPERIRQPSLFVFDKVRSSLVNHQSAHDLDFVRLYKSGNRRYTCRTFRLECSENGKPRYWIGILLERYSCGVAGVAELSKHFDLTSREKETVEFLIQGLTSKEIANRMNISPNTVKAFLRLVMVKMDVSTRSGIVGKIVASE